VPAHLCHGVTFTFTSYAQSVPTFRHHTVCFSRSPPVLITAFSLYDSRSAPSPCCTLQLSTLCSGEPHNTLPNVHCSHRQNCVFSLSLTLSISLAYTYLIHGYEIVNTLKPELNPICCLLALLGAHHFLHVSSIRVKSLTFRRLMSYIYMEHPFLMFLDHTQRRSTVGRTPLDE